MLKNVIAITKAKVALHSFLMTDNFDDNNDYYSSNYSYQDGPTGIQFGDWIKEVPSVDGLDIINNTSNNYLDIAKNVKGSFKDFFNQEGAADW